MKTKHTKGEWKRGTTGKQGIEVTAPHTSGYLQTVAYIVGVDGVAGVPGPETQANANLIAAAGPLLEALEALAAKPVRRRERFNTRYQIAVALEKRESTTLG